MIDRQKKVQTATIQLAFSREGDVIFVDDGIHSFGTKIIPLRRSETIAHLLLGIKQASGGSCFYSPSLASSPVENTLTGYLIAQRQNRKWVAEVYLEGVLQQEHQGVKTFKDVCQQATSYLIMGLIAHSQCCTCWWCPIQKVFSGKRSIKR